MLLTIIYENIYERMIMEQISISEIQRNLHKLNDFEILEVVDKKRAQVKGYFIDSKYAAFVTDLLKREEKNRETQESLAGSLHAYADLEKRGNEDEAWKQHIEKKYAL